jgi:hypothetical protein
MENGLGSDRRKERGDMSSDTHLSNFSAVLDRLKLSLLSPNQLLQRPHSVLLILEDLLEGTLSDDIPGCLILELHGKR